MNIEKIAILGGGNLGVSIAKGLLKLDEFSNKNLVISEKRQVRAQTLKDQGLNVLEDNNKGAIEGASIVIVSVKPQQINEVLDEIKSSLKKDQVIISTVTGVNLKAIEQRIGKLGIVRIMPNTAIEIKESMTCLTHINITGEQEKTILSLFGKLGKVLVIQEELMGAVTVLGACGVAFALRFIRAATQGGIEIGFGAELSQLIVAQTVKGASQLILDNESHPEKEIDKVTTPQGITISGLNEMEHQGFSSALIKGLLASYSKLEKLSGNGNQA